MSSKVNKKDGRQCASCGYPIFAHEGEHGEKFMERKTCRTESCRLDYRRNGRRFPEYREAKQVAVSAPIAPRVVPVAGLVRRRSPAWLLQPVENSVENPVSL